VKQPHKGREFDMENEQDTRESGNIWNTRQVRADNVRDLSVGIAPYGRRRVTHKPVVETTSIPEIPQDAA
jgi:hypothetical protein